MKIRLTREHRTGGWTSKVMDLSDTDPHHIPYIQLFKLNPDLKQIKLEHKTGLVETNTLIER